VLHNPSWGAKPQKAPRGDGTENKEGVIENYCL